jgi:hypothetical protein
MDEDEEQCVAAVGFGDHLWKLIDGDERCSECGLIRDS